MSRPLRVLVVDDSALMRKLIPQMLERDSSIEVVGTAMDGEFGLRKIEELRPHVITLDLEMPRKDGMETLREITRKYRIPVIVVSAHSIQGANSTFKALALGAFDFVAKPKDVTGSRMDEIAGELIAKIKTAAQTGVPLSRPESTLAPSRVHKPRTSPRTRAERVVAIGISTGGPNALQYVLSQLPGDFPAGLVVVQHMPEGFTEMFARRLDECCALEVKEARSGDMIYAGRVLLCPGDRHMRIRRMPLGDMVVLSDEGKVNGHRPSVDVLFRSLAAEFAADGIAVLMTGMGDDGADAMGAVKNAGGLTIAQDGESCAVNGMPKAAIDRGHALRVVSLDAMANTLQAQCAPERARAAKVLLGSS